MKTSHQIRLAALLLAATGAALGSFATDNDSMPPRPPPHEMGAGPRHFDPERHLARLTEMLNLSVEQQNALRPILAAQAEAMKMLADPSVPADQRRIQRRELFREYHAKISAVLTPAQRDAMAEMRPIGPRDNRGGPGGNRPPPPPEMGE